MVQQVKLNFMCSVCFKFWGEKKQFMETCFHHLNFFLVSVFTCSYGHLNTPVQTLFVACSQSDKASFSMRQRRIILNCESYKALPAESCSSHLLPFGVTTAHQLPPPHPITSILLCHMDALHGAQNEHHSYLLKRTVVYRHRLFTVHNKPRHSLIASKSHFELLYCFPLISSYLFFFF